MARVVGRHPRLWGALFALVLLGAYVVALRPARLWTAGHVARPLFASIETPRSARYALLVSPNRPDAVYAVPRGLADGRDPQQIEREHLGVAEWAAPVGVLFLLPAMFLLVAFPTRLFWAGLLGYHVVVGLVSLAVFAVGLGVVRARVPALPLHADVPDGERLARRPIAPLPRREGHGAAGKRKAV